MKSTKGSPVQENYISPFFYISLLSFFILALVLPMLFLSVCWNGVGVLGYYSYTKVSGNYKVSINVALEILQLDYDNSHPRALKSLFMFSFVNFMLTLCLLYNFYLY